MWSEGLKLAAVATALGSAIVGGLYVWISLNNSQQVQKIRKIDDETLILFLKDLKSQSYPHFFLVSAIISQVDNQMQDSDEAQVVKDKIVPEVEKLFQKKQNMVLIKYNYTLEEFNYALENTQNPRVQKLKQNFQKLYAQSLQGKQPDFHLNSKTIEKFDQDRIVIITEKLLRKATEMIAIAVEQITQEMGDNYQVAIEKPEFMKKLNELHFTQKKREVIVAENITQYENELDEVDEPQSPSEVYSKICQHHKNQDPKFKEGLKVLEDEFENIIQKLMKKEIKQDLFEIMNQIDGKKIMNYFQ